MPPFDDPHVIAGQGTVGLEIAEDVPDADLIVCPIGGGGLIAGIATAVGHAARRGRARAARPAFTAGLAAGKSVHIELQPTTADGLAPPFAGELNLAIARERVERGRARHARTRSPRRCASSTAAPSSRASPSGAAATAALLAGKIRVEPGSTVVAIVSGGNAAAKVASAILAEADED